MEKMLVSGVTRDNNVARIAVVGVADIPGIAFKIFSLLSQHKINVDIILQSIGRSGTKDISFTVSKNNLQNAVDLLKEHLPAIGGSEVNYDENVSKVSIVGAGMATNAGVAATMFEALFDADINIQMISTSEIKVSVLIDAKDSDMAIKAIHEKFNLGV